MSADWLSEELHALGRTLDFPPVDADALASRVVAGLDEPVRNRQPARRPRWRQAVVAGAVAVLIALGLTPAVRAGVTDWFGVVVRSGPPAESEPVPSAESALTLEAAAETVGFGPIVPPSLGPPGGVEVSHDERVLSLSWPEPDGTVRLDQFEGRFAPFFVKRSAAAAEIVDVHGRPGLWFDGPHHLSGMDRHGREIIATARSAGPTLLWRVDGITLRLEGADRGRALEIARDAAGT